MPVNRVLILGDERKGRVRALVAQLSDWLRTEGIESEVEMARDSSLERAQADLVVVCGGDGSMLAAARRMGRNQLPTLGINLGRLGFLTAFADEEAIEGLRLAVQGELREEHRVMMLCAVERAGGETDPVLVLNDAVLSRPASAGIVTISAHREEHEMATYSGDGLIVATPVGSTAYSLASGGPVVSPRMEALVLTPLAPHTLTLRPLVVPLDVGVRLRIEGPGDQEDCSLVLDGQVSFAVAAHEPVHLRPAPQRFRHLTRGRSSFYEILRAKFGWSDEPRRQRR